MKRARNTPSLPFFASLVIALAGATPSWSDDSAAPGFSSVSSAPQVAAQPATPTGTLLAAVRPDEVAGAVGGSGPALPGVVAPAGDSGTTASGSTGSFEMAERVLVVKAERRLYLLRDGRVIAEYPVKLGLNPYGHKQREGDFRTPEGRYTLNRRNSRSEFFLAIQVSYPSREDAAVAKEAGRAPGGLIMIHGQPNVPRKSPEFYSTRDWTDGCIALSNADMVDVWLRTTVGVPIEIRP